MATLKPTTVSAKRLSETISGSATSFKVNNIKSWQFTGGAYTDLTSADFGTRLWVVFRNSTGTLMEIMEVNPATITAATSPITILYRGLKFDGTDLTEVSANKLTWVKGDTIVEFGTHVPQLLAQYVDKVQDQTVGGVKTFSSLPATTAGNPVAATDLARKAYVDSVVAGIATTVNMVVGGVAGETLIAGEGIYLKNSDGRWWKTDADIAATVEGVILGIAQGAGTAGNAITGGVLTEGVDSNQTALTASTKYFFGNTAGAFSTTTGTKEISAGISHPTDATKLYFFPKYDQVITEDEQDAMAGNGGTPSSTNKFVTQTGLQAGTETYIADASGSSTVYTATFSPALTAYTTGQAMRVKIQTTNTTTTPTINFNGLGAKTIVKGVNSALAVGDLVANQFADFTYDGTNMVLKNPQSVAGTLVTSTTTAVDTTNTSTEQTLITVSLPGGVLGTAGAVRITIPITDLKQFNTTTTNLRLKYGATTVATITIGNSGTSVTGWAGELVFLLVGAGATNSQVGVGNLKISSAANTTTTANAALHKVARGTATEISTGALTLSVTAQNDAAVVSTGLTTGLAVIEKITV